MCYYRFVFPFRRTVRIFYKLSKISIAMRLYNGAGQLTVNHNDKLYDSCYLVVLISIYRSPIIYIYWLLC